MNRPTRIAVALIWVALLSVGCQPAADDANALDNTSWTVTAINGVAVVPAAKPTIMFEGDGTVAGSASCNQYSGSFRTDGDRITIGDLQSTLMLCAGEVGAQEAAFVAAMRAVETWRVTPTGELEMAGAASIVATPGIAEAPPPDPGTGLEGTSWNLAEMGDTADFARIVPTIEFGADGTVSGFAACNTFSGTFTTNGQIIALGPLATTKMACERPASAVETGYLAALSGVTTWSIEPDGRLLLGGAIPLRYTPR
jgi:heat shock protein HslJ